MFIKPQRYNNTYHRNLIHWNKNKPHCRQAWLCAHTGNMLLLPHLSTAETHIQDMDIFRELLEVKQFSSRQHGIIFTPVH